MYVYGKARCQWQRAFFMFVQTHKKAALPIIKVDAAFLLLVEKRKMWYGISEDYRSAVQSLPVKGVMFMVTYAELFQYSLVIIGIITLCFLHKK